MKFIANTDFLIEHYDDTKTLASQMSVNALDDSLDFLIKCKQRKIIKDYKEGKYNSVEDAAKELLDYCVNFNGNNYNGFIFGIEELKDRLRNLPRKTMITVNGTMINYGILVSMAEMLNDGGMERLLNETMDKLNIADEKDKLNKNNLN